MGNHPLLKELLQICTKNSIDEARGHLVYQSYIELSEGQKLYDLEYKFSDVIKMFYLLGKKEKNAKDLEIFLPVLVHDELSPEDMNIILEDLNPVHKKLNLLIRDADSSSTCYTITNGLIKPDSPEETKITKNKEFETYQLEKSIQENKKNIYMKALKNS